MTSELAFMPMLRLHNPDNGQSCIAEIACPLPTVVALD